MKRGLVISVLLLLCGGWSLFARAEDFAEVEQAFREMPMSARRLTGPLFWLHGDERETPERLRFYLDKVAEGHNGTFCAESRPHSDWLGPRWYDDLAVCLEAAKTLDMTMWIFDEKWWPSQMVAGAVPPEYGAKILHAETQDIAGGREFSAAGFGGPRHVAAVAGRRGDDGVDPDSLVDLTPFIENDRLTWTAPEGEPWTVMRFYWEPAAGSVQGGGAVLVDGASRDCVDWFIETVYQPHYDRFKEDFGNHIVGFFYDEPETPGDWGTGLPAMFRERGVDYLKSLVGRKIGLDGEAQRAALYAYADALYETWGRTMYGGITRWCEERGVASIGHFMEHDRLYLKPGLGAGNLFQMQKYSSMGGMDLVVHQLYPGQHPPEKVDIYQLPKLTSSISHVYDKKDHLAMCEIFGGYDQRLTYPNMKWLTDQHQVRGVNFMITHSFNPRAPHDTDYPPYFYNDGHEPRWPLYRVWADYTNRLSQLLTGGEHVCPVAFLFCGNSIYAGDVILPEMMTTRLQEALFDCDWLPYDVFEQDARIDGDSDVIRLHDEAYRVLIVPPAEVMPIEALRKARAFFEAGGVVVGYGFLPTYSADFGSDSEDVAALREAIWGDATPGLEVARISAAGGRSYFLPETAPAADLRRALIEDAGIRPTLDVIAGDTGGLVHALHRRKADRDIFFIVNQHHEGAPRRFRFRAKAAGVPELWDPMRNEISALPHQRESPTAVVFERTLAPMESIVVVFQPEDRDLPAPVDTLTARRVAQVTPTLPSDKDAATDRALTPRLDDAPWVWFPEGAPREEAPPGRRYFLADMLLPADGGRVDARMTISADNHFILYVNGVEVARSPEGDRAWAHPVTVDVSDHLRPGRNRLAIRAENIRDEDNPAGLIGAWVARGDGGTVKRGVIDADWRCAREAAEGWADRDFDASGWESAMIIGRLGDQPWGHLGEIGAAPPASPFAGLCEIAEDADLRRAWLVTEPMREGARVQVNGQYAGGFIGAPWRLPVGRFLKAGVNRIEIEPYGPESARIEFY